MQILRYWLGELLRPGDCFIDVGARNGVSASLPAASLVGVSGKVIAIEPDAETHRRLRHNIFCSNNRQVSCLRLEATDGFSQTAYPGVARSRLDDLCASLDVQRVSLIKINAPGAELAILSGLGEMLSRPLAPSLFFQLEPCGDGTEPCAAVRIQDLLEAADYDIRTHASAMIALAPAWRTFSRQPRPRLIQHSPAPFRDNAELHSVLSYA